jgi:hypothetical protein
LQSAADHHPQPPERCLGLGRQHLSLFELH